MNHSKEYVLNVRFLLGVIYAWVCACVLCGYIWNQVSGFIMLHLTYWRHDLSLNLELTFWLDWKSASTNDSLMPLPNSTEVIPSKRNWKISLKKWRKRKTKNWKKWINPLKKAKTTTKKQSNKWGETEIELKKNPQTKGTLEMKNLGKWTGTTDASITNRMQEIEERISSAEDRIEE